MKGIVFEGNGLKSWKLHEPSPSSGHLSSHQSLITICWQR